MQTPTYISISCLIVSLLSGCALFLTSFGWRNRNIFGGISLLLGAFATGTFLAQNFCLLSVLLTFVLVFASVNYLRIFEARMHEDYLKSAALKSFLSLGLTQAIIVGLWLFTDKVDIDITTKELYLAISISFLITSIIILFSTLNNIINSKINSRRNKIFELPTLTIAIAARNEDDDLNDCISCALSSNYEKLEILVVDDCSQDKTPDIIKSFAHDGVRFIKGSEPPKKWLAKNYSYQKLLEQSSGELILFIGVDVRLEQHTVYEIVKLFTANKLQMASFMPIRKKSGYVAAFFQPMRYWLELAIPREFLHRPPVLSTCWIVNRKSLKKIGGFKSITKAIIPEEHLAIVMNQTSKYKFFRANNQLGLTTLKNFESQWQTAVRARYPQLHRRPESTLIRNLMLLIFLVGPFVLLPIVLITNQDSLVLVTSIVAVSCLVMSNVVISAITNPISSVIAVFNFPLNVLLDIVATNISMYRYEFGKVYWRGREVSTPAMHVYPHLPKLVDK